MMRRVIIILIAIAAASVFVGWWLHDDPEGKPLVCEQLSPGVTHAKQCTPEELIRAREAFRWIIENAPPLPSVVLAGVASFIEDTGRRKRTKFFQLLSRHDIEGACEQMLAHINLRGQTDPVRVKRRGHERAMCLTKG